MCPKINLENGLELMLGKINMCVCVYVYIVERGRTLVMGYCGG